jgi:hypothetical protein
MEVYLGEMISANTGSKFRGFDVSETKYHTTSFECRACPSLCEIGQLSVNGSVLA